MNARLTHEDKSSPLNNVSLRYHSAPYAPLSAGLLTYEDKSSPVNVATPMRLRRSGLAPAPTTVNFTTRSPISASASIVPGITEI